MIDADLFIKNSPFRITHNDSASSYNLANTTPDLLKFQLQEQYRNKLNELKSDAPAGEFNLLNMQFMEDSFNLHLQSNLDRGHITLTESLPSLTDALVDDDDDDEMDSFILSNSSKPNYLNLKVLIENSILDTSKINKDSILSLAALRSLKLVIEQKKELHQYLVSKITISQQFISSIILKQPEHEELDAALLLKILKLNTALQDQLLSTNSELEALSIKLNNHNLACLVLGYVEDVRLSSSNKDLGSLSKGNTQISSPFGSPRRATSSTSPRKPVSSDSVLKSFDSLFSHIASIAAQRNIPLPTPPSPSRSQPDTIHARTLWAQSCIDAVLNSDSTKQPVKEVSFLNDSSFFSSTSPLRGNLNPAEKQLAEYKTALNDMRFSHQYLTKEYEISRESSMKLIQEYRKRIAQLEKELNSAKGPSSTSLSSSGSHEDLAGKDKEIFRLRKELNILKIDRIGTKSNNGSSSQLLLTSPRMAQGSYDSPILSTSNTFNISPVTGDLLTPSDASSSGMSNGILRKEFRKIVSDIQDQHEVELSEERIQRRNLQLEIEKLRAQLTH
ncbi:uncharacterized protein CANTADRAFT_45261 [Suhomyces tanzawaensis NRRL Y-17324]|uniref:Uncharacterized protein n=1 Tax=Suhomyces tanzawaensis NRRL Y-17324 TaxID=984487 RepID=A0A1E4SPP1_9ASCO|nr:uncharacterized protein CANTADRAFT_45261 [Suhomyces tanzawaensis NRRL Y-17324]ODV81362.1 hypothetical protein CANTADRAFT_45261 [Suhomyces tanzawaensis NRRL Y-17324]